MGKQIERAGDDNKNNIGVLYGIGVGPVLPGSLFRSIYFYHR